jgi:hypothetical protein
MNVLPKKTIIGRAEKIYLLDFDNLEVPAKVDTGADRSSIWASSINEQDGNLTFTLFDKESPYYSGKILTIKKGEYRITVVSNSFGHTEERYVVRLRIRVHGRKIKSSFTLANRSTKTYPILLGRRLLQNKFLVDVSKGTPLVAEEEEHKLQLEAELQISQSLKAGDF